MVPAASETEGPASEARAGSRSGGENLVLVGDASSEIGAGHAMRLLTLGEAWARTGRHVSMVGRVSIQFVLDRMERARIALHERLVQGDVLVVDSYDANVRSVLGRRGLFGTRVLVDDIGGSVPPGYGAVWNPNPFSDGSLYSEFGGSLLAGPNFVPLRSELPRWRPGNFGRTAVMLGGSRITGPIIDALELARSRLHCRFAAAGDWVPSTWTRVDARDAWHELVESDMLICGAGTTLWEAAAVGIPIVGVSVAGNQANGARYLRQHRVPVVVADSDRATDRLVEDLVEAFERPESLPLLSDGTARVMDNILALRRVAT